MPSWPVTAAILAASLLLKSGRFVRPCVVKKFAELMAHSLWRLDFQRVPARRLSESVSVPHRLRVPRATPEPALASLQAGLPPIPVGGRLKLL